MQRFVPRRCVALLLCAAVREEDRWIPVVLRLHCFLLLLTGFLRLIAQLLPLVAIDLTLVCLTDLHVSQRMKTSRVFLFSHIFLPSARVSTQNKVPSAASQHVRNNPFSVGLTRSVRTTSLHSVSFHSLHHFALMVWTRRINQQVR